MNRYAISIVLMLTAWVCSPKAQCPLADEADSSGNGFHLSVGSSLLLSRGEVQPLAWVAPSFEAEANSRLRLGGGFVLAGSPQGAYRLGVPRSLAPRKRTTNYAGLHAEAEYRISETTTLWGMVYAAGGWVQPWFDPTGEGAPLGVVALCGGVDHELANGSLLSFSFEVVHDRYGTGLWAADPYHGLWNPSPHYYGTFSPWLW